MEGKRIGGHGGGVFWLLFRRSAGKKHSLRPLIILKRTFLPVNHTWPAPSPLRNPAEANAVFHLLGPLRLMKTAQIRRLLGFIPVNHSMDAFFTRLVSPAARKTSASPAVGRLKVESVRDFAQVWEDVRVSLFFPLCCGLG